MTFPDRCAAAFTGLALGDAYGRPLEFVTGPRVRTMDVDTRALRWTDDTHMSWYLAQAVAQLGPDRVDVDVFAERVGERFEAWLRDPLTPSTAPGNTCMAAVRAWSHSRDWHTSGVSGSDGCGAVMRAAPLAMALSGSDLSVAAKVQAALTHHHPNAWEAATAASFLLRWTLERGRFDASLVHQAIARLRGPWREGGVVAEALEAALEHRPLQGGWLDEDSIPTGDGGWRSASALGLAVAACLEWGHDFELAIDRAARIQGDSDSVAALVGMFLGAAGRPQPEAWLAGLPWRGRLEAMGRKLGRWGRPIVALPDLHGHLDLLEAALATFDARYADYTLVTLGDYCDNGPQVPALLQRLARLQRERGQAFRPILGNHDLACLRAMDDPRWGQRWMQRYWNPGGSTLQQYGVHTSAELGAAMGEERAWLEGVPWVAQTERYCFVHAGMYAQPLAPQVRELEAQVLPADRLHLPQQLRHEGLAKVGYAHWDRVVVSAHTGSAKLGGPIFEGLNRICVAADVEEDGHLLALALPDRAMLRIGTGGSVQVV